jgi:predicted transcriptional regulator
MNNSRTISFRIEAEKVAELDRIAKNLDRDRSYLLNEAVEAYLGEQKRFRAMVEEGLRDLAEGRSFSDEEVGHMVDEWAQAGR